MRAAVGVLKLCAILCLFAAQPVFAGAWMRDKGTAFFSVGTTFRMPDGVLRQEYSTYGEYGVSPFLTLGLDYNETPGLSGHFLMFARFPVAQSLNDYKVAFELGLGGNHYLGDWDGMIKTTVSVGRNFSSRWGSGWFNVDGALELRRPARRPALKLDATIGLKDGRRIRPMLQLESTYISGKPLIWSIVPSVMIDGRKNKITWVVGIERKTLQSSQLGLRFSIWRRF